jgi:ubiquinone/menaquinone biosynthesis C-methylase UbiE
VTSSPLCDRNTYFAQLPTIALANQAPNVDLNVAMQVLMGAPFAQCRRHPHERLERWLGARGSSDIVAMLRGEPRDAGNLRFASDTFGLVDLRARTTRASDRESQWYVHCDIRAIERRAEYDRRFEYEARRQLAWDSYAISYDRVLPAMPYYREVVDRHVEAMGRPGIERVIDVGAGTGNVAIEVARTGRTVVAIDVSRAMLDQLRAKLTPDVAPRVRIHEDNGEALADWPDDAFDGVTILLVLYDAQRPSVVLREALRVLRPGGVLVVTEPKRTFRISELLQAVEDQMRERGAWNVLRDDWARVCEANRELSPEGRDNRLFVEDIVEHLRRDAFEDLVVRDSHFGRCATVTARRPGNSTAMTTLP